MKISDLRYQQMATTKEFQHYDMREIAISKKVKLPSILHDAVIAPIWDLATGEGKGVEQFVKENINAFNEDGYIKDYSKLKLTTGDLYMPNQILLEEDPVAGGINFFIDADVYNKTLMKNDPERKLDRLCYVLIQDGEIYSSIYDETTRDTNGHYLKHPIDNPKNMHVFVFFCDQEMKRFSPAEYQMMFEEE
ncbi:hypothetical protein EYV94_21540 [Puteibacter caeruleilacunae]|nr:hypothetical protein EYV94_21540 [Puteibacter caeruleilacunae]